MVKILCTFRKCKKIFRKIHGFEDNLVWSSGAIFSQLWQECMWAAVNVLKTGSKISDQTKRDHKYLDLLDINRKLA